MRLRLIFALLAGTLLICSVSLGCRYTVRDVGFVDIASSPYKLYCYVQDDTPKEHINAFKQVSYAALMESNVQAEVINIDQQKDHPAMRYFRFWEIEDLPAAVLVSPDDGRSLPIPLDKPGKTFKESVWSALDEVLSSPKREEILKRIVEAYCIVLLLQGKDEQANEKARKAASDAIDEIKKVMSQLPKPVEEPPHLIVIPRRAFPQERILLWSLGVEETESVEPHLVVLYGRGRRIGPILKGERITANGLFNILSVVGSACECGLDRGWVLGKMIPLKWDEKVQSEVIKSLGFDAENPMVKAEVSQILAIGLTSSGKSGEVPDTSQGIFYGYEERIVEYDDEPPVAMLSPVQMSGMDSPEPDSSGGGWTLRTTSFILIGISLLILAGGAFIILRARRRET
jgi:hypothetical protein